MDSFIDALMWGQTVDRIVRWGSARESRYICICNVHVVVTARGDPRLQAAVNDSDMSAPDGMPLVWTLRRKGFPGQLRVSGPDLMERLMAALGPDGPSVFFYGSTPATLDQLLHRVRKQYPRMRRAGAYAPPFREMSETEDARVVNMLNDSGAGIVFVGLGCPKQETWMAAHRGAVKAVMIGVGAAFDYHAGTLRRAPVYMQELGFEWLYRLIQEPRRLLRRYLLTNSVFITHTVKDLLTGR